LKILLKTFAQAVQTFSDFFAGMSRQIFGPGAAGEKTIRRKARSLNCTALWSVTT
jgi:hypothetical protein